MFWLSFIVYFVCGLVNDAAVARYYIAVHSDRAWEASFLAAYITAFNLIVISNIVVNPDLAMIIAFALGTGAGTGLAMKIKQ